MDTINIRPRRQITLPKAALEAVKVDVGEKLTIKVVDNAIVLQPLKEGVISTFTALQKALQRTTSLSSLQKEAKRARKQLWQQKIKSEGLR